MDADHFDFTPPPRVDYVIVAGQSNALGYTVTAAELPAGYVPDARVQIWTPDGWATMDPGHNTGTANNPEAWGPEVGFALAWGRDHGADDVLRIVKSAKGSTGLAADANALDWSPFSRGELFDTTTDMVTASGAQGATVLWYQGETDAADPVKARDYWDNLNMLRNIAGGEWGGLNGWISGYGAFAGERGPDGLHFNGAGQLYNGQAFYDEWVGQ